MTIYQELLSRIEYPPIGFAHENCALEVLCPSCGVKIKLVTAPLLKPVSPIEIPQPLHCSFYVGQSIKLVSFCCCYGIADILCT